MPTEYKLRPVHEITPDDIMEARAKVWVALRYDWETEDSSHARLRKALEEVALALGVDPTSMD